ncbi:GNAT family N-acetyltransferase [Salipiger sp. IMCC34102]|uniref:N-acyl amino acid synthase FeeM domain-containing protein n=1 Tax=Salipiger sp. IMCC34102 TaxID=2510647 RepID=UPI00101CD70C|nr:acyl-homoserine-lactone synthase [Salipiger sp. IMCC34102]RYH01455.1 GNAT family N-acetyltransferase [Salipiger sp. IMCC34102]
MSDRVISALNRAQYRVLTEEQDLEEIYRLRYDCYRAENSIPENERGLMTDAYDETPNCVHVAVDIDGEIAAAVRLHLVSRLSFSAPTLEVFPEVLDDVARGRTVLDSTRFVIDPSARKNKVPLHFLVLRVPFLATIFYDVDLALAPVRAEHTAFYCRYLGYEPALEARSYPGLAKPVHLLTAKVREQRAAVLARTPVFGPMDEIPQSNIDFPELSGIYAASKKGRSSAA